VISALAAGTILGLFAGLAPGPYTTMVVATALERGFRKALPFAFTPFITDMLPLICTVFVLDRLNWTALTILGVAGGAVVMMIGVRFIRHHGVQHLQTLHDRDDWKGSARGAHVIATGLLNPAPWLFWLVVGSPLFLASLAHSRGAGAAFLVSLFFVNIGSASTLAWLASRGRLVMPPVWQRRILVAAGTGLILTGAFLAWQALDGGFQSLIDRQETLRSVVESGR